MMCTRSIPPDRTLDTVTGAEWRAASLTERTQFLTAWQARHVVSCGCLVCHYPVARGGDPCAACEGREGTT